MAVKTLPEKSMNAPQRKPTEAPKPSRAGSASPLRIYKPGQGAYVRWGTAGVAGIAAIACADFLFDQLALWFTEANPWPRYLIPVGVLVGLLFLTYWLVGRSESIVNFMIATEGEMKKVNWSSRREVIGATKVVIVTTLSMAFILFAVDLLFMGFFGWIGVLQIDLLGSLFAGGPQ